MYSIIFRVIVALLGVGGVAYGVDQGQKRSREQAAFRAKLKQFEDDLTKKETELEKLRARLGEKNDQVRALASEVQRLRREIEQLHGGEAAAA
jgi:capsule polysaccharide export protein KpsE/RkpR